jgi:hypothetical protein
VDLGGFSVDVRWIFGGIFCEFSADSEVFQWIWWIFGGFLVDNRTTSRQDSSHFLPKHGTAPSLTVKAQYIHH